MSQLGGDDLQWRRPAAGSGTPTPGTAQQPASPPGPPPYTGPPPTVAPPRDWQPRVLVQAEPPRALPPQDLAALDTQEREARTVTYGIGMVSGAVLLIVLLVLCGRVLL